MSEFPITPAAVNHLSPPAGTTAVRIRMGNHYVMESSIEEIYPIYQPTGDNEGEKPPKVRKCPLGLMPRHCSNN